MLSSQFKFSADRLMDTGKTMCPLIDWGGGGGEGGIRKKNQRTEGPESRTNGETLIFWD